MSNAFWTSPCKTTGRSVNRKFFTVVLTSVALFGAGCGYKRAAPISTALMTANLEKDVSADIERRFIAERDKLEVITSKSELQKSWEAAIAFCGKIQCEVVSSNISTPADGINPSGTMTLRVVPDDWQKLLARIQQLGLIAQHVTEREDLTGDVVDTEAKIKNLSTFRDSLRSMLAKPSAKVSDLVEIQKQLTDTQATLDSEIGRRKVLANQTEKISVEISFRVESSGRSVTGFSQIWNAFRESGDVLADSTASLITTVFAIIPWLVLVLPVVWLLGKAWRKVRELRKQNLPPQIGTSA